MKVRANEFQILALILGTVVCFEEVTAQVKLRNISDNSTVVTDFMQMVRKSL